MLRTVFGANPFAFFLRLDAVNSTAVQQVFIESLQVQRSQVCQWNTADLRLDVVLQKALSGLERGRSEFDFCVVFHPDLQPTPHGVGFCLAVVDTDIFFDGLFQFFLDLGLRLSQHIFDDGLASFRISANRVPAFPASVLALSDVPFSVCSSFFRHGISPFRNEQYRKQGNKATGKRNCYQKVIICLAAAPPYL